MNSATPLLSPPPISLPMAPFPAILAAVGVSDDDFRMVTGSLPWTIACRPKVRHVMDAISSGVCETAGVPAFELPAEYSAAVIGIFVSPTNCQIACRWLEKNNIPLDVLEGSGSFEFEPVSASRLFALLIKFHEGDPSDFIRRFNDRARIAIERSGLTEVVSAQKN